MNKRFDELSKSLAYGKRRGSAPRRSGHTLIALAILCLAALGPAAAQSYTITDLNPGRGNAINTYGQVVSFDENGGIGSVGYLWIPTTPNGTIGASSVLPSLPPGRANYVYNDLAAINASGIMAGTTVFSTLRFYLGGLTITDAYAATLWQNGTATALPGKDSFAYGINDNGDVVGIVNAKPGYPTGWVGTATLWQNGKNKTLTAPNGYNSEAIAINNIGQIVGQIVNPTLWQNGNVYDLGNLPGFSSGRALAINASGLIVGRSGDGYYTSRAFLWRPVTPNGTTGSLHDLGVLPGFRQSIARGINASGTVVGGSNDGGGDAFVWDSVNGMRDLNALIPTGSGWRQLVSATAINDKGQIAGWGYRDDSSIHAFLLTPR